ncbi:histone-fold-containing protein [Lipomyces kononenkoae]
MSSTDKVLLNELPAATTPKNGTKSDTGKKKAKSHSQDSVSPMSAAQAAPTGQVRLPLARVKRIIKLDEDVRACSNSAAFAVTVATEMFIQYMCEQGLQMSRSDRRKTLHYKDLANAVHKLDELEFLSDVVPRTIPLHKVLKDRRARAEADGLIEPMPDIEPASVAHTDGANLIPGTTHASLHDAKAAPVAILPKGQTTLVIPRQPPPSQTEARPPPAVVLSSDLMDED